MPDFLPKQLGRPTMLALQAVIAGAWTARQSQQAARSKHRAATPSPQSPS